MIPSKCKGKIILMMLCVHRDKRNLLSPLNEIFVIPTTTLDKLRLRQRYMDIQKKQFSALFNTFVFCCVWREVYLKITVLMWSLCNTWLCKKLIKWFLNIDFSVVLLSVFFLRNLIFCFKLLLFWCCTFHEWARFFFKNISVYKQTNK